MLRITVRQGIAHRDAGTLMYLLLTFVVALYVVAPFDLICTNHNSYCETSTVSSIATPIKPPPLNHCPSHCLHNVTLLPIIRSLLGMVAPLMFFAGFSVLLRQRLAFAPLSPPPKRSSMAASS